MHQNDFDHNEGPGAAVIVAYAVVNLFGLLEGLAVGWLIWG